MWQCDPTKSNGLLVYWHIEKNGRAFYRTITLNTNVNNVKMIDLKMIDPDTGELVAESSRAATTNTAAFTVNKAGTIKLGKIYTVQATIENMSHRKTTTIPNRVTYSTTADENIGTGNRCDGLMDVNGSSTPLSQYETTTFTWNYTINPSVRSKLEFLTQVNDWYYLNNDNRNLEDDFLKLYLSKPADDMTLSNSDIVLLNGNGDAVSTVIAGQPYSVGVYVHKPVGDQSVGGSEKNPYATVDISYNDGFEKKNIDNVKAKNILYKNGTAYVQTDYVIVPKTSFLRVFAKIDDIHHNLGFNDNTTNDSGIREFASDLNVQ